MKKLSTTGVVLVGLYALLYSIALWSAVTTCPSMFCSLYLYLVTLPWSFLLDPGLGAVQIGPLYGFSLYLVSTLFFCLNACLLYFLGKFSASLITRMRD